MRKLFLPLIAVAAFTTMAFTLIDPLPIGSAMPKADVKLKDISGKEIILKNAKKENGLLIMFSCNTCPYVIKNQERTSAICKFAADNKIGVVLLNSNEGQRSDADSYKAMQEYAKEQKYSWSYAIDQDSELANAFGANRTPECFLFNKELKLSYHGAIDDNPSDAANITRHHLKEAITELVAGKEITVKESRSVGCSIKRKS